MSRYNKNQKNYWRTYVPRWSVCVKVNASYIERNKGSADVHGMFIVCQKKHLVVGVDVYFATYVWIKCTYITKDLVEIKKEPVMFQVKRTLNRVQPSQIIGSVVTSDKRSLKFWGSQPLLPHKTHLHTPWAKLALGARASWKMTVYCLDFFRCACTKLYIENAPKLDQRDEHCRVRSQQTTPIPGFEPKSGSLSGRNVLSTSIDVVAAPGPTG